MTTLTPPLTTLTPEEVATALSNPPPKPRPKPRFTNAFHLEVPTPAIADTIHFLSIHKMGVNITMGDTPNSVTLIIPSHANTGNYDLTYFYYLSNYPHTVIAGQKHFNLSQTLLAAAHQAQPQQP